MRESDVETPALSLTDAVKASAGRLARKMDKPSRQPAAPSMTQSVKKVASRKRNPPATRTGRKGIVLYFDQHVAAAIRRLASEYDATNQELGEMAFKFLFEKFGEAWPG
jgi:hypothetical protein